MRECDHDTINASLTAAGRFAAKAEQKDTTTSGTVSQELAEQADAQARKDQDEADLFKPQDEEEFDYLQYANDRAMFVWGDALRMGIVKASELPEELLERVKLVEC